MGLPLQQQQQMQKDDMKANYAYPVYQYQQPSQQQHAQYAPQTSQQQS
jgi:hypothetical protein